MDPRELRHSFVSLLSDSGVPVENISRLVGTAGPLSRRRCIGTSYALLEEGAVAMDEIFPAEDAG